MTWSTDKLPLMRSILITLATLVLTLFSTIAVAHEIRPALLAIKQETPTRYTAVFKQPQIQGRFLNLNVQTNCEEQLTGSRTSSNALQDSFVFECPDRLNTIRIVGLENTLIDTMITLEAADGEKRNYLVNGREPEVSTAQGTSTPIYFILGMEHLFFGIDHVLFVLLLLYLVSGWRNLVAVVTSFTVAHSITLGLSAFDIVTVSQAPVEALIALSIVLLAAEALREEQSLIHRKPWLIAFVFGLLHGLGFASALSEIGLPEASEVMALLLFNIGIEVGQLTIIAVALGLTWAITRTGFNINRAITALPVYAIGGLSSYWFIDRTLQVLT